MINKIDFDLLINNLNKHIISPDQAWKNILFIRQKQEELLIKFKNRTILLK